MDYISIPSQELLNNNQNKGLLHHIQNLKCQLVQINSDNVRKRKESFKIHSKF